MMKASFAQTRATTYKTGLLKTGGLALLLAAGLSACASSGPSEEDKKRRQAMQMRSTFVAQPISLVITGFDANGDTAVTKAELLAGVPAEWARLDGDQNGRVSPVEMDHWAALALGSRSATPGRISFDKNSNGTVSEAEFGRHLEIEFNRLDRNEDGILVRAELVRLFQPPTNNRSRGRGGEGGGGGGQGGGGQGGPGGQRR